MMTFKYLLLCLLLLVTGISYGQNPVMSTPASDRNTPKSIADALKVDANFLHATIDNIGPSVMSGRVTDIEVNPSDATNFLVAYASGGLWITHNNGTSFTPLFDHESVMTIGDIAVDWDNKTIYLGSGEVNSSRSSYAGNGIYKSTDMGATWHNIGLTESHHIGRIVIDANNSNRVLVAACGHLYSPNPERGFYLSEDGGKTWQQTLYVNENTGGIDIIQDPLRPNTWYGATWQRERRAWNFEESGQGSGIYKSTNGGKTWSLLSTEASGFVTGEGVGRIGLDIGVEDNQSILYAVVDNYFRKPPKKDDIKDKQKLTKENFRNISKAEFVKLDETQLTTFLKENGFDEKYTGKKVIKMVESGDIKPNAILQYLEDANSLLFDTEVIGAELYISKDEGTTFTKTHNEYIEGLFNSYGYYFAQVVTEPTNPAVVYLMGVPIIRSDDYGKTWTDVSGDNVHSDHHSLWVNPSNPRHIINGNDGGVNISYDKGAHWLKCNTPSVGQFYAVNVDYDKNYNVYGGLQDNGVWYGPHTYKPSVRWHQSGHYPYESILGGDGMQVQIDRRDNATVYTGFQFGNYFRINRKTGERSYITPKHDLGQSPYRWNWETPILLSSHNQDILYMGANMLLRSMDKGNTFSPISPDLTHGGVKGDVAYGTIVSISESKSKFGKILVGTDDGRIQLTEDGGNTWKALGAELPPHLWVSSTVISRFDDKVMYVALNGYRWDDFNPYLYVSRDNGASWTSIAATLPIEPINVIYQDDTDAKMLYVGTDNGLYMSIDGGASFHLFNESLPRVAVHDVVIQEVAEDLIIGTHGRSLYKANLHDIRQVVDLGVDKLYIACPADIRRRSDWGRAPAIYDKPNVPSTNINIYNPIAEPATLSITLEGEKVVLHTKEINLKKGLASYEYDLSVDPKSVKEYEKCLAKKEKADSPQKAENGVYYLMPGDYKVSIKTKKGETSCIMKIK